MNNAAMFKLGYGLYVLIAKEGEKDNGCIINTVMQVTDVPKRVVIAVNKSNYTHDMIVNSKKFNISVLDTTVPFSTFEHFGFQSGKDVDKFMDYKDVKRSENGLYYLENNTNAFISCDVVSVTDLGTHSLFVADVIDGEVLNDNESVTYDYYHKNIKPAPQKPKAKGYVCKICGYVYEGEELPSDFVCPLCKHGPEDFEEIK